MSQIEIKNSGIDDAAARPCEILYRPTDPVYCDEHIRNFQGCPTLAISKGGRIFVGWYSGGTKEPHIDNFNLIVYSDDDGETFSQPLIVIPGSRQRLVQSLDIQLWIDPDGRLHVFWVQNNVTLPEGESRDNFDPAVCRFGDRRHAEWEIICDDPDADNPVFSEPRLLDIGFLRCKPLVTKSGRQINFNYDQTTDRYGYSISDDKGATWTRLYGAKKIPTSFDEGMAYQLQNGDIRMFARCRAGELAETTSHDDGMTWDEAKLSGIDAADTRLYVSRTPSGRVLLITNDCRTRRENITLQLSEDDGATWKYKLCIDPRFALSYPDADFFSGKIYLTYDRERTGAKEILFAKLTEDDIINGVLPEIKIISKP